MSKIHMISVLTAFQLIIDIPPKVCIENELKNKSCKTTYTGNVGIIILCQIMKIYFSITTFTKNFAFGNQSTVYTHKTYINHNYKM